MKKMRITVNKGSSGKKFKIFNSPESLYVWLNDPDLQAEKKMDPSLGTEVHLKKGETMEVEWRGCEFIYEASFEARIDYIRLGKVVKVTPYLRKDLVGIQDGWIVEAIMAFKPGVDDDTKTTMLTKKSKHKFDLDMLFAAMEDEEETPSFRENKTRVLN